MNGSIENDKGKAGGGDALPADELFGDGERTDGDLVDHTVEEHKVGIKSENQNILMRGDWSDAIRSYIKLSSAFTMGIIFLALLLDAVLVVKQIESDPSDRLLNTQVILALIAASVAQIGAIAYLIGKSIFK